MSGFDGFYKVLQVGSSYISATFYNPITHEEYTKCVRDYEYADCSRDNDELYYMPICETAQRLWMHHHGVILTGDIVKVIKGRTIEHGYIGKVVCIRDYRDRFGRWIAKYVYFEDGRKINIDNVELLEEV